MIVLDTNVVSELIRPRPEPTVLRWLDAQDALDLVTTAVAARQRAGRPIDIPDAQIAAICRLHGATLATRNERDFEGTGVSVFNPWR